MVTGQNTVWGVRVVFQIPHSNPCHIPFLQRIRDIDHITEMGSEFNIFVLIMFSNPLCLCVITFRRVTCILLRIRQYSNGKGIVRFVLGGITISRIAVTAPRCRFNRSIIVLCPGFSAMTGTG